MELNQRFSRKTATQLVSAQRTATLSDERGGLHRRCEINAADGERSIGPWDCPEEERLKHPAGDDIVAPAVGAAMRQIATTEHQPIKHVGK